MDLRERARQIIFSCFSPGWHLLVTKSMCLFAKLNYVCQEEHTRTNTGLLGNKEPSFLKSHSPQLKPLERCLYLTGQPWQGLPATIRATEKGHHDSVPYISCPRSCFVLLFWVSIIIVVVLCLAIVYSPCNP